jgi:phage shock protein PspC (stress-responsive transcriptional regulator)
MDTHDPKDPQRPEGEEQPREHAPAGSDRPAADSEETGQAGPQSPVTEPTAVGPPVRRLYRSRSDRMLGGVCGGIGRYFGIDSILVRIVAVVGLLLGGATLVAYIAALLLVPNEPPEGASAATAAGASAPGGRSAGTIALLVIVALLTWPIVLAGGFVAAGIALPVAILALTGLAAWWLVSGEGAGGSAGDVARRAGLGLVVLFVCLLLFLGGAWLAGIGGGTVAAGLVIGAGVVLVIGAFAGGVRWLALPAVSLALGVGLISAAGVDLDGGVGERDYSPSSAADLRDTYELGMGELVVDLRNTDLPRGDTHLDLRVGMGEARVVVPRDVCVASSAEIGAGNVHLFGHDNGGLDVDWDDERQARPGGKRLVVNADVGMGELRVRHDRSDDFGPRDRRGGPFGDGDDTSEPGNTACVGSSDVADA